MGWIIKVRRKDCKKCYYINAGPYVWKSKKEALAMARKGLGKDGMARYNFKAVKVGKKPTFK